MTAAAWIAVVVGVAGLFINIGTLLVGYGVLRGTVQALASRVTTLEGEMRTLADLKTDVAVVQATLEGVKEQLKDLNASIRWIRQPAEYEPSDLKRPGGR